MSEIEGLASPATGTSQVMDHMGPGASPSSREYDGRDPGDVESARAGVDLLFTAIGSTLCSDASPLALDRDRLLWGAVDQLRSHVARLEARLDHRLEPPEDEDNRTPSSDDDMDAHDAEFLPAHQAENIRNQIGVLREALEHGLNLYGQTVGRPWLARQGSLDAQFTDASYGAQIDAATFFATREDRWKPAPETLTRVQEAADGARDKRSALRASASAPDSPTEEIPATDAGRSLDAAGQMFHALTRIYPDGTQLQDERTAGAWRIVRMLDANAELSSDDVFRRMRHHPAFGQSPDDRAVQDFDDATRASLVRTECLAQATDAAAALYLETTEREWQRDDPAMSAAGGPRTRTTLTGADYASARRAAELGHPAPTPLDGPHILVVGDGDLAPRIARETVVPALNRLRERIPEMVLHYGARLQGKGGKSRIEGVDPAVRRWATGRRVPLIPNPPRWDPEHKRYNIHARDDAWIALKPDLIVDFGGRGNAHNRLLALADNNGIPVRTAPARAHAAHPAQDQALAAAPPLSQTSPLRWAGIGSRETPDAVLQDMTELSRQMAAAGFHLHSGGARGADTAFAAGTPADQRTIWLPRPGFEGLRGPDCHTLPPDRLQECIRIAGRLHPAWHRCEDFARKAHARNVAILLGPNLDNPVDAVVCWTLDGKIQGGTGLGLLIAREWKIPVFNLATLSRQQAWTRLQRLHQSPAPERTVSATERAARHADREQRHALRNRHAVAEVRAMRTGQLTPSRAELARQHEDSERRARFGRLYQLTSDQLETALTRITEQMVSLDRAQNARAPHHPVDTDIPVRLAALKETYIHTTQALIHKVGEERRQEREAEALAHRPPDSITRERALTAMHSLWRLTEEGPLATEPNRLLREAAKAFNAQHRSVDERLATERRERAGLNLENTPGSEREHLALARSEPDREQSGEAFEYMLSPAELHERDQAYQDLVARSEHLSLAASTADIFAKAGTVDMSRRFDQRDRRRTRHLDGANTPEEIRQRHSELRAAHRQLIDTIYTNIATLCPDDHPSAVEPSDLVPSDRDMLLSRFAAIFRTLQREVDKSLQHISRTGKGANRLPRLRETASYLRELSGYAEKAVSKWTGLRPHARAPATTQSAGDWLMERQKRARDLHKTETLAPDGRHLAIVGGRSLGREHGHRVAELLNAERARTPDTPLVIHCINHEGAGLHAAEWAAMHGVACVTHRPTTYAAHHLQDRDTLLIGIPPATLWTFGAGKDRAASELVEAARNAPHPIEIRNMEPDMDGPLSHDILIDPPEIVDRECARIREAWEDADIAAGETALIYQPGIEALKPDINRVLTSPHLTPGDRSFLTSLKAVLESETRVRDEIVGAVSRGREHLAHYQAILERHGPTEPGTPLKNISPEYRRWDVRAEKIVQTFDNWFANEDPAHRDHIDRKRVDLVDIAEELRAIRQAARSANREPHQVALRPGSDDIVQDQRFDPGEFAGLIRQTFLPEDERNPEAVYEFARQSRAWPKQSLSMVRAFLDHAAQTREPISTRRIAQGLPPGFADGIAHINEEVWTRQAAAITRRQAVRDQGRGLSA